jgi:hypothetical protein
MKSNHLVIWATLLILSIPAFSALALSQHRPSAQAASLRKIKWYASVNNIACIPGGKLDVYVNNKLSCSVTVSSKRVPCGKFPVGKTYNVMTLDGTGAVYTASSKTKIPNKSWVKVHYMDLYCFG